MPKIITPAMRAHLDEETTRLAAIWRITRKDGQQFFFTDHDRDVVFGGEVYRADAGFERTAIRSDAGFAVDNLDLVGVFAEGGIVEDEVRAGLFDGAEIAISFVNWEDPDGHGEIRLRRGTLGETRLTPQGYFHAELRGLSQPLAQSTLEVFSPNCRADLGDHRCKFPIQPPELGRNQAVSEGAFYRVPTAAGTGSARYEDRIYEMIETGTTGASQPAYDTAIGATTTDGTATLKAYDSFTRVASVEAVTDHRIFTLGEDLSGFADGWFDEGAITFEKRTRTEGEGIFGWGGQDVTEYFYLEGNGSMHRIRTRDMQEDLHVTAAQAGADISPTRRDLRARYQLASRATLRPRRRAGRGGRW
jgi:hypothetical protein